MNRIDGIKYRDKNATRLGAEFGSLNKENHKETPTTFQSDLSLVCVRYKENEDPSDFIYPRTAIEGEV